MVPPSMTLSDLWPGFQCPDILLEVEYLKNGIFRDGVTIAH